MSRCRLAERSRCRDATSMAGVMWSARYRGACPCNQRYIMRPSLKVTLFGTSNQCCPTVRRQVLLPWQHLLICKIAAYGQLRNHLDTKTDERVSEW